MLSIRRFVDKRVLEIAVNSLYNDAFLSTRFGRVKSSDYSVVKP